MNKIKALKMAVKALERQRQQIAFGANLYKRLGPGVGPKARKDFEEYEAITTAIEIIGSMAGNFTGAPAASEPPTGPAPGPGADPGAGTSYAWTRENA